MRVSNIDKTGFSANFYSSAYIKLTEPLYETYGFDNIEPQLADEFSKETKKDKNYNLVLASYSDLDDETDFTLIKGKGKDKKTVAEGSFDFLDDSKHYNVETLVKIYNKLRNNEKRDNEILKAIAKQEAHIEKIWNKYEK